MRLTETARALRDAINSIPTTKFSPPFDVWANPAEYCRMPKLDPETMTTDARILVLPFGLQFLSELEDSCDLGEEQVVSVAFLQRIKTKDIDKCLEDMGRTEFDDLTDFVTDLFKCIAELQVGDAGKPFDVRFVSPGNYPIFYDRWIREAGVFASFITVDFQCWP